MKKTVYITEDFMINAWKDYVETNGLDIISVTVWGVPRGGTMLAHLLYSKHLCQLAKNPYEAQVIVDDCTDSGATMDAMKQLYPKAKLFTPIICSQLDGRWAVFPWEKTQEDEAKDLVVRLFQHIGEDPTRVGLLDTPRRVVKMYSEIYRGYDEDKKEKITTFPNGEDGVTVDQMICDTGDFYSMCEHHMMPFIGRYWFAYIPAPNGLVLGLSKVARVVDYYSAKLQIQERLGKEILDALKEAVTIDGIPPVGIAICLEAEHLCKSMRGVKKKGKMRTLIIDGRFKEDISTKSEFLNYINANITRQV
jgi:GTP cyclohydrolase I